jgi:arylsulfatase
VGRQGLHVDEITLADVLKGQGYATCIVGKWHLGDAPPFLPTKRGFDEYFGIPYSNDMGHLDAQGNLRPNPNRPPLPLYEGETIIETEPDQRFLTRRFTERAVDFINRNKDNPFFLFIPHPMPHVPLFVHPDFEGTSEHGLYGDVIQELDWSVGEVLKALRINGIEERTMIVYTSDNGPWLHQGVLGGHAEPLRSGKATKYEGGHRVICIMKWKGQIKPGTVASDILANFDLMPTFVKLAGTTMPPNRKYDGLESWDYISGVTDVSPRETLAFGDRVVRHGKWKLFMPGQHDEIVQRDHFNSDAEWQAARQALVREHDAPRLYDLEADIGESQDVSAQNPAVVAQLQKLLEEFNREMRTEARPLGRWEGEIIGW